MVLRRQKIMAACMGVAAANRLGLVRSQAPFYAPLRTSIVLARGIGNPTYTRATTATMQDWERLITVPSGAARFQGARMVRNYIPTTSENFNNAAWVKTNGSITATGIDDPTGGNGAYTFTASAGNAIIQNDNNGNIVAGNSVINSVWIRRRTGTGTIEVTGGDGSYYSVPVTGSWLRLTPGVKTAVDATLRIRVRIVTSGDAVDIFRFMAENVTGQSNQNPSEYVSVGVLAAPYHGAGVDGVKYFDYQNGNTVASNVVTEATGAPLTGTIGYLGEESTTQLIAATADIRDMTTANWTLGATLTRARTSTGVDGVANSATRLTGGAASATNTITYTLTAAASNRTYSAYVKRITGTGPVRITQDNFATNTDISGQLIANQWVLVSLTQSQLNAVMGFKIDTDGDAIDVDCNQFVAGTDPKQRILTGGATCNQDVLTYPASGNISGTVGTIVATAWFGGSAGRLVNLSGSRFLEHNGGATLRNYDGTAVINIANIFPASGPDTQIRNFATSWSGTTQSGIATGMTSVATGNTDGSFDSTTTIGIGGAINVNGIVRDVYIWSDRKSDALLQALTR